MLTFDELLHNNVTCSGRYKYYNPNDPSHSVPIAGADTDPFVVFANLPVLKDKQEDIAKLDEEAKSTKDDAQKAKQVSRTITRSLQKIFFDVWCSSTNPLMDVNALFALAQPTVPNAWTANTMEPTLTWTNEVE